MRSAGAATGPKRARLRTTSRPAEKSTPAPQGASTHVLRAAAFALALILVACAKQAPPPPPGQAVLEALPTLPLPQAAERLDNVLVVNTEDPLALLLRADCLSEMGDLRGAFEDLSRAIGIKGKLAAGWHRRGALRRRLGQPLSAVEDLKRAVILEKTLVGAMFDIGVALLEVGDFAGAEAALRSARRTDRSMVQALWRLGQAAAGQGKPEKAVQLFDRMLEAHPQSLAALLGRIESYRALGRYGEALADADQVIGTAPTLPLGHRLRARILKEAGREKEALASYTEALRLAPQDPTLFRDRGNVYDRLRMYGRAVADWETAIRLRPGYARELDPLLSQARQKQ